MADISHSLRYTSKRAAKRKTMSIDSNEIVKGKF